MAASPSHHTSRVVCLCAALALASVAPERPRTDVPDRAVEAAPGILRSHAPGGEPPALPAGVAADWWTAVRAQLEQEAYVVRPVTDTAPDTFEAGNPAQQWQVRFTAAGVAITPVAVPADDRREADRTPLGAAPAPQAGADWCVALRLAAYGAGGELTPVPAVAPRADGARVEFRYGETAGGAPALTEWYVNDTRGLEHGFTLAEASGGSGPVTLELVVAGGLRPTLQPDGRAVELRAPDGTPRLRYADLFVTDADGRTLPSRMAVPVGDPARVHLVVDTRDAVYPVTIDPLLSDSPTVLTGEAASSDFGYFVASAGDVNGDGYDDVVVGAYGYSSNTGRAYVYLGGPSGLATAAATTLTGETAGDAFGWPVAPAGDVNGDGYDDVVVGAPWNSSFTGRAYVYLGGAGGLSTSAATTLGGEAVNNYFGQSVATAGDVNFDGYADLVVGAYGYGSNTGRAYVYLGGASGLSTTAVTTLTGEAISNSFGQSVATAGDVDGDAYADVVVGAWGYSTNTGRAYVYLGSANGTAATATTTLTGESAASRFGVSVATAGDVNGDGYADLAIGASGYSGLTGRAYVYLGGAGGLSTSAATTLGGEAVNNYFGGSVATAGDVNGDGYSDVVVGAPGYSSFTGRAYVYLGGAGVAGDFDGDLKSDILWRHATRGEVWLWPMDGTARLSETYVRTVADTGWEIRGLGDQTGDGQADILWRHKTTGMIYLWPMSGSTPLAEVYVATVDPAYDIVGTGDYNGDHRSDILWRNQTNGEVWIWLMYWMIPLSQVHVDTVDPAYVIKGSGDVNGDGKADIVWHHGTSGEVWVWLMNGTTRTSQTHVGTVGDVGYQIVGVADHTGDGKADILWHHATRGEVWIWPMDGTTVVSQSYVDTVPDTGYQIVGTGDYNGDTKADILWHHATRGEVWVWLMNGTTKLSQTWVATVAEVGYQIVNVK